jgi:DNA (cytosine-5)-methyltransferase 1
VFIRYADMFAGIGGFALGARNALGSRRAKHACGCDIDKDAAATYLTNFGIDVLGDISMIDMASLPECDIVFGGFPCQPFSRNGMHYQKGRLGIAGKESLRIQDPNEKRDRLYLYLADFLNAKKPARFLFENVKGLQSMMDASGKPYFNMILSAFEQAGYDVFTKVLDAADFGLPQQRKRLFFVGFRKGLHVGSFAWPVSVARMSRIADILEPNADPKYLLEHLWRKRICSILTNPDGSPKTRLQALREAKETERARRQATGSHRGRIVPLAVIYNDTPSGGPRQMDKLYSIKGISPTIATFSTPAVDAPQGWRILTPRECARLQGFPDSFQLPKSDAKAYRQIGNAVSPRVVSAIVQRMFY